LVSIPEKFLNKPAYIFLDCFDTVLQGALWVSTWSTATGCVGISLMRPVSMLFIVLLFSGCVSSVAEIRQAPPDQVGNFSASAPDLSYCVLRSLESIESPFEAYLNGAPDQQEFILTVRIHVTPGHCRAS
jgi:hypothetical protein